MTIETKNTYEREPVPGVALSSVFDRVDQIYYPADEYPDVLAERRKAVDAASQGLTARAEEYLGKKSGHRIEGSARTFPRTGSMPFAKRNGAPTNTGRR